MANKVQGNKTAGRGDEVFGGKLVGIQLADTGSSSALFTLGNFEISRNISQNTNKKFQLPDFDRVLTAQDIVNGGIEDLRKLVTGNEIEINYNRTKLENFIEYGSSLEGFRNALTEIMQKFPAALTVERAIDNSVRNYYYNSLENIAAFTINPNNILNPFDIIFSASGVNATVGEYISKYRNFSKEYENFTIKVNGLEYDIVDVSLPADDSSEFDFEISVIGNPFTNVTNGGSANETFYISPNSEIIEEEINNLSDLAYYLLNWDGANRYTSKFIIPIEDNAGDLINESRLLTFPLIDGYNPDVITDAYDDYTSQLYKIAEDLDRAKTDLISRFYTTSAFKEYDTEDLKVKTVLQLSGHNFDALRKYIQGILHMRKVSYDKIDNVPDLLIKNFAHLLGWETFEIEDEETLVQSLFNFNNVENNVDDDITPQELDIELWRRLVINSFYLFKSKGTRKSIEMVLKMVGVPRDVIEITENVYVAQNKLQYDELSKTLNLDGFPIDENGYPTVPNIPFQSNGGYFIEDTNNIGPYDYGKLYVDQYKKFNDIYAFDIYQVADNKKSWVKSETDITLSDDNTNYKVKNTDLIINSKELDIFLSSNRVFDLSVYRFFKNNDIAIDTDFHTGFTETIQPVNLTFYEYLKKVTTQIDPRNRKVTHTYPKLSKLYYQYLVEVENLDVSFIDYSKSLGFLSNFDNYWVKLVRQFTPATSILTIGKKVQNSPLLDNKYKYKHGKNDDVQWLGTDGSEFQSKAKIAVWDGEAKPSKTTTIITRTKVFVTQPIGATVLYREKVSGFLDRKAKFSSYYYGFFDYCDYESNALDEKHGDFGNFTNITPNDPYIADTTLGLEFYIQNGDTLPNPYGYTYFSPAASFTGTITSISLDKTNTLSNGSLKVTSKLATGSYTYNGYVTLTDVSVENGVDYEIKFKFKYESDGIAYDFYIFNTNGSEVSSGITSLGNGWYEITKVVTPSSGTMDISLVSTRIYEFTTVYIDSVNVNQYSNQGFEEAYNELGVDFFCPPPLPHICYLPFKDGVTGDDVITKIINTRDDVNNFKYPANWDLVNIIPPTSPITITNLTGTPSGSLTLNGLLFNNPYTSNIGAKQLLIYDGPSSTITKSDVNGLDVYFESLLLTSNAEIAKLTPVLVKSNDHTESGITVTYPHTWTTGSFSGDMLNGMRGVFYNSEIPNGSYHFGVLIEHHVKSSFKFRNFRLSVKNVYGDGEVGFTANQLPSDFNNQENLNSDFYPLMHVKGSYITKKEVETNDDYVELNLRDTHNLRYVFFNPDDKNESVFSNDGIIDNQTFLSDSVTFEVEAIYPTKTILENSVELGPFYNLKSTTYTDNLGQTDIYNVWSLYGEVNNNYLCPQNQTTVLGIINPFPDVTGSTFINNTNNITFTSEADANYFELNGNTRLRVDVSLIFDSDFTFKQEVLIKLINEFGTSYIEESFVFAGSDNVNYTTIDSRTANISFTQQLGLGDKVYIAIEPFDAPCRVLESEDLVIDDYEFNIVNPSEISSLGDNSGSLSDTYSNISFVQTIDASTFGSDITNNTLVMDEYTRVKLTISERPTEVIPDEYKEFTGYLLSIGKNYDEVMKTGWANDTAEFYISKDPVNRMDFYPYVENGVHAPLDRDWTAGQSILNAVQNYQDPVFNGYSYTNVGTYGSGTTVITGNTLSGNIITLTKHSSIRVYESVVSGMSNTLKNSFDFFDTDLKLKTLFSDQRMDLNYFQTYFNNIENLEVELVNQGSIGFETNKNGVKLKYFFEKDYAGYPKTGEYIAKMVMSDVCNNSITGYTVFLINSDYAEASDVFINATNQAQLNISNLQSSTVSKNTTTTVVNNTNGKTTTSSYNITIQLRSNQYGSMDVEWIGSLSGNRVVENGESLDLTYIVQPNTSIDFKAEVNSRTNNSEIITFNANGVSFVNNENIDNEITTVFGRLNNINQDYIIVIEVEGIEDRD